MTLSEAYCVEMSKVVDIYMAQQHYFEKPEPRKRFKFECSDEKCREKFHPTVTGVLYDRPITDDDTAQRMQFNWGPNAIHAPDCPWVEKRAAAEKARAGEAKGFNQESNRRLTFSDIDSDDVIDIFSLDEPTIRSNSDVDGNIETSICRITDPSERIARYADHFREKFSSTSRLEQVVNCYERMDPEERKQAMLTIQGIGRKNYAQFFRKIEYWQPNNDPRIYMGGASLRIVNGGYRLSFYGKTKVGEENYQASLYLTTKSIEQHPRKGILMAQLNALLSGDYDYARCYFFGTISKSERASNNLRFADANIKSLHHLVLILKTKARK